MNKKNSFFGDREVIVEESPMLIPPSWVKALGFHPAVFLHQVHYWIKLFASKKDKSHYFDDHWWIYDTYEQWHEQFFWWNIKTIKRIVWNLQEQGVLLTCAKGRDRTHHYAIDYEVLQELNCIVNDAPTPLYQKDTIESINVIRSNAKEMIRSTLHKDNTKNTVSTESFSDMLRRKGFLHPDNTDA